MTGDSTVAAWSTTCTATSPPPLRFNSLRHQYSVVGVIPRISANSRTVKLLFSCSAMSARHFDSDVFVMPPHLGDELGVCQMGGPGAYAANTIATQLSVEREAITRRHNPKVTNSAEQGPVWKQADQCALP
mgnify:CR=1 FL=1